MHETYLAQTKIGAAKRKKLVCTDLHVNHFMSNETQMHNKGIECFFIRPVHVFGLWRYDDIRVSIPPFFLSTKAPSGKAVD